MRINNEDQDLNTIEDDAQLIDFGLTDAELDSIKGGRTGSEDGGGGIGGDWVINHNETMAKDNTADIELTDLRLTDEELDGIKGGRTGSEDGGGGIWLNNHNETTAKDNATEIELDDLGLTDEEMDSIKGGRLTGSEDGGGGGMGGDWVLNHNETILTDTLN